MKRNKLGQFKRSLSLKDKATLVFFGFLFWLAFVGAYTAPSHEVYYQRPSIDKELSDFIESRTEFAQALPTNSKLSKSEVQKKVVNAINILTTYTY